jgi:serine/threonine protein kinase
MAARPAPPVPGSTSKSKPDSQKKARSRTPPVELPVVPGLEFRELLGSGHFSHVYAGTYQADTKVAIKIIESGSDSVIESEIGILFALKHVPQVIRLHEALAGDPTILVFEFFPGMSTDQFFAEITLPRFRFVIRSLLEALKAAHHLGIVHRDVKMSNIMVATDWSAAKLIDWGCGASVSAKLSTRAGSRTCRSLEMLLGCESYKTGGDMWAVGVFIYYILCGGKIPWKAATPMDTIVELASFYGGKPVIDTAKLLKAEIPAEYLQKVAAAPRKRFNDFFAAEMKHLRDRDLINLMQAFISLRKEDRPSAAQAVEHRFFTKELPPSD